MLILRNKCFGMLFIFCVWVVLLRVGLLVWVTTIVGGVAEWSKALVLGTSLKGRGFESHLHHNVFNVNEKIHHTHTHTHTQYQHANDTSIALNQSIQSTRIGSVTACIFATLSASMCDTHIGLTLSSKHQSPDAHNHAHCKLTAIASNSRLESHISHNILQNAHTGSTWRHEFRGVHGCACVCALSPTTTSSNTLSHTHHHQQQQQQKEEEEEQQQQQ